MDKLPPLVQRTIERFIRAFAPQRIVLFGSYAKGKAQPGSDIDLLIVADLPGDARLHLRRAKQLAGDCFPPIDVIIASPGDVKNADKARSPFLQSILGSGVAVYERK